MVDKSRRKELLQEYAERKPPIGVYAVRCGASGGVWVGWSRNVDKRWNALRLQAEAGRSIDRGFQAAFTQHGSDTFTYDVLEHISEDNEHTLATLLPERAAFWRRKLGAGEMRGF